MTPFFYAVYALVVLLVSGVVGAVPGWLVRALLPFRRSTLVLAALPIALAWWIWAGWLAGRYGISRLGLVLYAGISAAGFVRGWVAGVDVAPRLLRRGREAAPRSPSERAAAPRP